MNQSIHSARVGIHLTLADEYLVEHRSDRTYCIAVKPADQVKFEPESGRGNGIVVIPALFSLTTRQELADQYFSPRNNKE